MFGAPARRADFADLLIDLHERARAEQWVQSEVAHADVAIEAVAEVEMLYERDGNFTPNFDHAIEEIGIFDVKGAVKANRKRNSFFRVVDLHGDEVGVGELKLFLVMPEFLQIDAEKQKEIGELDAVNGAECVEFVDAGNGSGIFDLGEPGVGDGVLWIVFDFGQTLAQDGDVTRGDPEFGPDFFELLGWLRGKHAFRVYPIGAAEGIRATNVSLEEVNQVFRV